MLGTVHMIRLLFLLHAIIAAAALKDHRGAMCGRCKDGALVDGGTRAVAGVGCVHWCSPAGYCGDGDPYRRGLDCRHRSDVDAATLARATEEAEAQRGARYDAAFVRRHGAETFEQYKRGADHGALYGAAISIRGERHCGTGWVRVMTNENCRERHYWSPKLDADGLYGWKHDFLPEAFSGASRDAVVVVFRSAAPWAVKMRKTAYSGAIDRLRGAGLHAFLAAPFVERGVAYKHARARADVTSPSRATLLRVRAGRASARRRGGRLSSSRPRIRLMSVRCPRRCSSCGRASTPSTCASGAATATCSARATRTSRATPSSCSGGFRR